MSNPHPRTPHRLLAIVGQWSLILCLLPAACTADSSAAPATKPAPAASAPTTKLASAPATAPMAFDTTPMTIKGFKFTMEVAENNAQNERGLMYRDFLPADHGMIFVMPYEDTWSFWMHETRIPLDIVYLDKRGIVIEVHKRAAMDETGRGPALKALYVVELNLGVADKIGLKPGDIVEIPKKYVKN